MVDLFKLGADIGPHLRKFGQIWPCFASCVGQHRQTRWPKVTSKFGRCLTQFGQSVARPKRPILVECEPMFPRQHFGNLWTTSELAGIAGGNFSRYVASNVSATFGQPCSLSRRHQNGSRSCILGRPCRSAVVVVIINVVVVVIVGRSWIVDGRSVVMFIGRRSAMATIVIVVRSSIGGCRHSREAHANV